MNPSLDNPVPDTPVLDDPADLTPQWLTDALRSGTGLDLTVTAVSWKRVGTGQVGASYRVALEYAQPVEGAPDSVVVKMGTGSEEARAGVAPGFASEVGFYLRLAERVRARIPRCWYGAISTGNTRFTLVLEDLAPSVPGSQVAGCDLPQAIAAVRNLADLHASFWNDDTLSGDLAGLNPLEEGGPEFLGKLHVDATEMFVERFGEDLPAEDAATLRAAAQLTTHWTINHQRPFSVVHGDYRLDNLMFGVDVAALDWQTLSVGHPARDLAYFIANSLPTELRRTHERELVAEYHRSLVSQGVTDYTEEECFQAYRIGMLHGPLITVLGAIFSTAERSTDGDAMFLSMAARSCAAIRDLDTVTAAAQ